MKLSLDWKFWLVLVATMAGVAAPVWLWRFDLASRSVSVILASQTALSPLATPSSLKLTIAFDGKQLDDPYSSVVIIANNGAKPILPSEIEGHIAIEVGASAALIQAQVIETQPTSLTPSLSVSSQSVIIQPLLLNPGDSITVAILTAKGSPILRPRARVVGIQDVALSEGPINSTPSRRVWMAAICAPLAVSTALMLMMATVVRRRSFNLLITIFTSIGSLFLAVRAAAPVWDAYFDHGGISTVLFSIVLTSIAALLAFPAWSRVDPAVEE